MNQRKEPEGIRLYHLLKPRMELSQKDIQYFNKQEKGFYGEQQFDKYLEKLTGDIIILNDFCFEVNNTYCQIDSLVISQHIINLFEVKNYHGDFYVENNQWYSMSGNEIKNPVLQVNRNIYLFKQLLHQANISYNVKSHLVFVNPHFTLYQAPLDKDFSIVFPTQLNHFIETLNISTSLSTLTGKSKKIIDYLLSKQIKETTFKYNCDYSFDQLLKGITCPDCESFLYAYNNLMLRCNKCNYVEKLEGGVKRSIDDLMFLFPNIKITTNVVYQWCGMTVSKHTVRRTLIKYYKLVGNGKAVSYVRK